MPPCEYLQRQGVHYPPRQLSSLRYHKAAASFVTIASRKTFSSFFLLPISIYSALLGKNLSLGIEGSALHPPSTPCRKQMQWEGQVPSLFSFWRRGAAGLFSTVGQWRPLVVMEITAHRWRWKPSTYFVHDPVSIFDCSFNNLLDSLWIVFI